MKRLLLLLACAGALASCLDEEYGEPNIIQNGSLIYSITSNQQDYTMDPVNTAFRLNILLNEAEHQNKAVTKVMYKNADGQMVPLIDVLLPSLTSALETTEGEWELTFADDGSYGARTGKMIVKTGGLKLEELYGTSAGWHVALEHSSTLQYNFSQQGQSKVLTWLGGTFMITAGSIEQSWFVMIDDYACHYNKVADQHNSSWSGQFTVTQSGGQSMLLDECDKSTFAVRGKASGIPYYSKIPMTYLISKDLVYKPSCRWDFISQGTVVASFDERADLPLDQYPSLEATVQWEETSVNCRNIATMTYNGSTTQIII